MFIFFALDQLAQIRKVSLARMLCDIGPGVTEIQPRAYELPTTGYVSTCLTPQLLNRNILIFRKDYSYIKIFEDLFKL